MPTPPPEDLALLRGLLRGSSGWWASARLRVLQDDGLLPPRAALLVLRRPLMGVPAGVRVEDADGAVLARGLGEEVDDAGLRPLLDPLALATGLPPAVGALPSRERRQTVERLVLADVEGVVVEDRPCLRGVVSGLPAPSGTTAAQGLRVVLDTTSGLPLSVGPLAGPPVLALRVEELDPRLEDDVLGG